MREFFVAYKNIKQGMRKDIFTLVCSVHEVSFYTERGIHALQIKT